MAGGFGLLDLAVVVAYLSFTTALGVWLGRGQKGARDYFVADRSLPWWAVMFSIVASETSALTFISIPGLAYAGDLGFLQIAAGYILGRIIVARVLLPLYFQGELVTAYALLENRFGPATRRFASIVFMVTRAMADSVRVFATAIPIALIIGPVVPRQYLMPSAILVLGILTIVYTYRGGMRAVVWTELVQAGIYLAGGISAIVLLGNAVDGGWGTILSSAGAAGKLRAIDLSTSLDRPHTIFAGLIGGAFLAMASHGADQMIVQPDLNDVVGAAVRCLHHHAHLGPRSPAHCGRGRERSPVSCIGHIIVVDKNRLKSTVGVQIVDDAKVGLPIHARRRQTDGDRGTVGRR